MNARGLFKSLAIVQMALSLALGSAVVVIYATYEDSIGSALKEATGALSVISTTVGRVAQATLAEQATIAAAVEVLQSGRKLTEAVQSATEEQEKLLPLYVGNLRNAAKVSADAGRAVSAIGGTLEFSVPTSIQWDGAKPIVVYTRPLAAQASSLSGQGQELHRLGESLGRTADALDKHGHSLGRALSDSAKSSDQLLAQLIESMSRIKVDDLPKMVKDLDATAQTLREISAHTATAEKLVSWVLAAALLLAGLCACNALLVLLLARWHSAHVEEGPAGAGRDRQPAADARATYSQKAHPGAASGALPDARQSAKSRSAGSTQLASPS